MKVLVVHCSYKFKGGEDTVVSEEIALLREQGAVVELLQFSNERNVIAKILQLPFNISSYIRTRRALRSFKADVVHIHNFHFAGSASILYAIKSSRVPFVITLHNYRLICPSAILFNNGKLFLDSIRQAFPWNAVKQGVYKNSKLLTFWVCFSMHMHQRLGTWKLCKRFIVLTPHSRSIFLQSRLGLGSGQIAVKPNFCSVPTLSPVRSARSDYFLYVGRLSEEKGMMLLLKAFAASGNAIKIAGDGPLKKEVLSYSSQYPNIEYAGPLEKNRIFDLLRNCSALVFPSIWYEGMPLTIIEAFACGAPVIASRMGAMESMINPGYNGLQFEPGDQNDLNDQLRKWKSLDGHQRESYRVNARQTYEDHYTPGKNIEQLLSIYTAAIGEAEMVA